jgi:opacity protein-like surface antigen
MFFKVICSLFFSTSIIASQFNGAYIGGSMGNTNVNSQIHSVYGVLKERIVNMGDNKLSYKAFAGYGGTLESTCLYLGAEVFFRYDNLETSFQRDIIPPGNFFSTSVTFRNSVGGNLIVGHIGDKYLIYVKGGLLSSNTKIKYVHHALPNINIHKNKNGKLLGAGGRYILNKDLDIGIDYNYITYGTMNVPVNNQASWKIHPQISTYHLGLYYKL